MRSIGSGVCWQTNPNLASPTAIPTLPATGLCLLNCSPQFHSYMVAFHHLCTEYLWELNLLCLLCLDVGIAKQTLYPDVWWCTDPVSRCMVVYRPCIPMYGGVQTLYPDVWWCTDPVSQCMVVYRPCIPMYGGVQTLYPDVWWCTDPVSQCMVVYSTDLDPVSRCIVVYTLCIQVNPVSCNHSFKNYCTIFLV